MQTRGKELSLCSVGNIGTAIWSQAGCCWTFKGAALVPFIDWKPLRDAW